MIVIKRSLICNYCEVPFVEDVEGEIVLSIRARAKERGWKYNPGTKIDSCPTCFKHEGKPRKDVYVLNTITNEVNKYPHALAAGKAIGFSRNAVRSAIGRRSLVGKIYAISFKPFNL